MQRERGTTLTLLKYLAVATTVGMFIVLVMGATVTNTGSAEGCGRSWPLCNGQFIPEFAVATLIEFSHRAVTGAEGLLVVALTLGAWILLRQRREIQVLAPLMLIFLLLQAGLGALAVVYPEAPGVLALHFGISLIAFASVFLTMRFIQEVDTLDALRDDPLPASYRRAVWGTGIYVLVVVYLGALVRHATADLACPDWPLCNGKVFPGFSGAVGIVFAHRLASIGIILLLAWLVGWSRQMRPARPDLYWGSVAAFGLVILQALSGALIVTTRLGLFSTLAHAGIIALLFASLTYLCMHVLPRGRLKQVPGGLAAVPKQAQIVP